MKRTILTVLLLALPFTATAQGQTQFTSRAECVLHWMDGVMNDQMAEAVVRHCKDTLVGSKYNAKPRAPGADGLNNAFECLHRHAAATTSEEAVDAIEDACKALYPRQGSDW